MHLKLTESRLPYTALLLIAPFFLWGTAMVSMKGTLSHTTPLFMAGVRVLPAGLLILLATIAMGRPQPKGWFAWLWIGLFGLVDGTLFQGFLAEGLTRTGAGLGSVMIDSQPLAVALMARFLFGEQVGIWGWLGLALGVVGISLLGIPQAWLLGMWRGESVLSFQPVDQLLVQLFQNGQWLMLLAALSMAVGTVLVRYVSRHADPVAATGWHMVLGGIPLFLGSAFLENQQWQALQPTDWLALAYSTIFGSALAYGLFFYFASTGNLTSFSSLTFLTPVFALLFGNLFLAETLDLLQWSGVVLTLVSIYLINQREQLQQKLQNWRVAWQTGHDKAENPNSNLATVQPGMGTPKIGASRMVEAESDSPR
jgi:drug/metabolite transporter (DMT)-like permease